MTSLFEIHFLAFLIVVHNKPHFCNSETKLDKTGMFFEENFDFENLTLFDLILTVPWVKLQTERHHRIPRST